MSYLIKGYVYVVKFNVSPHKFWLCFFFITLSPFANDGAGKGGGWQSLDAALGVDEVKCYTFSYDGPI